MPDMMTYPLSSPRTGEATAANPGAVSMSQPKGGDQKKGKKEQTASDSEKAAVSMWTAKIKKAKDKWKKDFKRMRDNINFAAGLQWEGQMEMDTKRYVANITNHAINSKVAQLYARNPTAEYQRRPRLDFQLYDGKLESLMPVVQMAAAVGGIQNLPPQAQALLADFAHGQTEKQLVDRIGKTLEYIFQRMIDMEDEENGNFTIRAKNAVRQVVTTGVAYCEVSFVRDTDAVISAGGVADSTVNRAKLAKALLEKVEKGEVDQTSAKWQQLQSLFMALGYDMQQKLEEPDLPERIVFDFKPSTSIIPDPKCTSLKGFIGAHWLVEEYCLPINDIKAIFECPDLQITELKNLKSGEKPVSNHVAPKDSDDTECLVWRLINKKDRTEAWLVDGYKKWLQDPQVMDPCVSGFWQIIALTFNDCYVEHGLAATIFPPSDVQLMKSAQQEWNRSRNELKKHRKANSPGWITIKGMLTSADKGNLEDAPTNGVTELEGVPLGTDLAKVFTPRPKQAIEPAVYETQTFSQDIMLTTGGLSQSPLVARSHQTATAETIAQQGQMSVTASNVDDLDNFLSQLARISGELTLKEMQPETAVRLVGVGAVLPQMQQSREDYANQIYLSVKAASSGRPNKAVDLRNWQIVGPMLQQLGANPQFLVRETLRRLDDQLDPEQAFPLIPPPMQQQGNQPPQGGKHQPSQQGEHEHGQTAPPQQGRPGPGPTTPQREANESRAQM